MGQTLLLRAGSSGTGRYWSFGVIVVEEVPAAADASVVVAPDSSSVSRDLIQSFKESDDA